MEAEAEAEAETETETITMVLPTAAATQTGVVDGLRQTPPALHVTRLPFTRTARNGDELETREDVSSQNYSLRIRISRL